MLEDNLERPVDFLKFVSPDFRLIDFLTKDFFNVGVDIVLRIPVGTAATFILSEEDFLLRSDILKLVCGSGETWSISSS